MDNFLRPSTLFRASNFESYLNEKENGQMSGPKNKQKSKLWGTGYPKFHNHDGETFGFKCPRCNKLVWSDDHPCLQTEEAKQAQEMGEEVCQSEGNAEKEAL
jgi:hypothetical protein